jgi:hypothetical protein
VEQTSNLEAVFPNIQQISTFILPLPKIATVLMHPDTKQGPQQRGIGKGKAIPVTGREGP